MLKHKTTAASQSGLVLLTSKSHKLEISSHSDNEFQVLLTGRGGGWHTTSTIKKAVSKFWYIQEKNECFEPDDSSSEIIVLDIYL